MGLEGDLRIKEVTILDPFLAPRIKGMKDSVLDVRCKDLRGISYIVEMQVRKTRAFLKRIQYNAAKAYVNQIASADDYPKLNQVIAITITDFTLFDELPHYTSHHRTREESTGQSFLQEVAFYFIELSKFNKDIEELDNILDKWVFFIKTAGKLETIPDRLSDNPFHHAFEKAMVAGMDPVELEYYDKACMAIADARGAIELARDEGKEEGEHIGEQRGERKKAIETLQRLLMKKLDLPTLPPVVEEKLSDASLEEIEIWTYRVLDATSLEAVFKL